MSHSSSSRKGHHDHPKNGNMTKVPMDEDLSEVPPTPKSGPSVGQLDLTDLDLDLNVNPDQGELYTGVIITELVDDDDAEVDVEVGPDVVTPAPLPTRLRPGTPSPSKTETGTGKAASHVKQKIRQMSLSADHDLDGAKQMHPVTGSKSAPVPHRDHGQGQVHHHHQHHAHIRHHKHAASSSSPHRHRQGQPPNDRVQFRVEEPETIRLHQKMGTELAQSISVLGSGGQKPSSTSTSPPPPPRHHRDRDRDRDGKTSGTAHNLAVVKGSVYIPTRTKVRPTTNSFIETSELGPPGAERRWLVDMKGFREDEITFSLDGVNLRVEGKQSTRPGKPSHHSENISIPVNYDVEALKVYRNKAIGTLVLAYLPEGDRDTLK